MRRILALTLLVVAAASRLAAQPFVRGAAAEPIVRGGTAQAIHDTLTRRAASGFSGAIIVEVGDSIVLRAGYGHADRSRNEPFTTQTIAQIGSLTKQFTATAIVDLARRGKLRLDDSLGRFVPKLEGPARQVTLRTLLNHSSGAPSQCGSDFDLLVRSDLVSRCAALIDPSQGGRYAYSNLGYSLLAAVVEVTAGMSLERYLRQRFLDPLGLVDTRYDFPGSSRERMALGYDGATPSPPISQRISGRWDRYWNLKGNGGMQSTVEEMYRWYRAMMHGSPKLHPELRRQMVLPGFRRDSSLTYGFGWNVRTGPGGAVEQVSHTGGDGTFFAAFVWRPRERTFWYLVTNTGGDEGATAASAILRLLRD
jgi:CubicO group peptidase (beta-lactamase class C family)